MFIGDCQFKTEMPENVLSQGYISYIKSKTEKILNENEVASVIEGIKAYQLLSNFKTKRKHIKNVNNIENNKIKAIQRNKTDSNQTPANNYPSFEGDNIGHTPLPDFNTPINIL